MENVKLPRHVGIIMDGNGRWANLRGKERSYGHKKGSDNVEVITEYAFQKGIKALTLYAFSCENWARPQQEVDELMRLLKVYFKKFINKILKNGIRLVVVGDKSKLSKDLQKVILDCEQKSRENKDFTLNLAINYGGRQEVVNAVNTLVKDGREISVENITDNLYTSHSGEVDLIIRTGGEYRISNFLLFQGAYAELYFTDVLWPDFNEKEFQKALDDFAKRNRRFGKV